MNRTSTNNDIVKYIYNELEEKKHRLNFKGLTEPRILMRYPLFGY